MPLRQKSPDFVKLFDQEVQQDPKIIINLLSTNLDDSRYLHWSELIRRTPPEGLTHDQWWLGLKLRRNTSQRTVPLANKHGKSSLSLDGQDSVRRINRVVSEAHVNSRLARSHPLGATSMWSAHWLRKRSRRVSSKELPPHAELPLRCSIPDVSPAIVRSS